MSKCDFDEMLNWNRLMACLNVGIEICDICREKGISTEEGKVQGIL